MTQKTFFLFFWFSIISLITLGQKTFPRATIGSYTTGEISKDSLVTIRGIETEPTFSVLSYEMVYFTKGITKIYSENGSLISKDIRTIFNKCKSGDRLVFQGIKILGSESLYKLSPITLKVK